MHVKETVLVCTAQGDTSETARWRTSPSVLHFFLGHLLYAQPGQCLNSSLASTLDVAESMMEQREVAVATAPPLHKTAMQIIRAAAKHDPMQLLMAANASLGAGSWVAAHAAMLLYRDPRFADALGAAMPLVCHPPDTMMFLFCLSPVMGRMASCHHEVAAVSLAMCMLWCCDVVDCVQDDVGGGAQWQQHMCLQPGEFFALRAASDLATGHERLWRPVATSLLSCKQAGRAATISIAESWPCIGTHSADADAITLHLQSVSLPECATAVKLSASMAALHEGRLAEALALSPARDGESLKAFAPYLEAAMRQHAVSPVPLHEPPAVLLTVAELAQACVSAEGAPRDAGQALVLHGAPHARSVPERALGWRQGSWECVVTYAKLCHACSALADAQHSAGSAAGGTLVPKGGSTSGTSTARLRGVVLPPTIV